MLREYRILAAVQLIFLCFYCLREFTYPGPPGLGISPRRGQLPTSCVLAHIVVAQVGLFVACPPARALDEPLAAPNLRPWILLIGGFILPFDGGTTLRTVTVASFFHVFLFVLFG